VSDDAACQHSRALTYLVNSITATRDDGSCSRVRSSNYSHRYEQSSTRHMFGERAFSVSGPARRNNPPPLLHELINTATFNNHLRSNPYTCAFGL